MFTSRLLSRRDASRAGLSISTHSNRSSYRASPLSPPPSPASSHSSSESTLSRSDSAASLPLPPRRLAARVSRSLNTDLATLRSARYSAARESLWESELGGMQRLDIKPDAYSEAQESAARSAAGDDEIEVELEVKRARGGSDGQQQHTTATSLILHRKRRWLRPSEHSAQLSHYSHWQHAVARAPLPHQLVETRTRPGLHCACRVDGQRLSGRLLFPTAAADSALPRPLRLPLTELWLLRDGGSSATYRLSARVHGSDVEGRPACYRDAVQ